MTNRKMTSLFWIGVPQNVSSENAASKNRQNTRFFIRTKGVRRGGFGGSNHPPPPPPIGLSTKMHSKENITFLALLSLFFCNDTDSNMI